MPRATWEDAYGTVASHNGLRKPIPNTDRLDRPGAKRDQRMSDLALSTSQPDNTFSSKDQKNNAFAVIVKNNSHRDLHVELIGTGVKGGIVLLAPSSSRVTAAQSLRNP